jgi:hypothetical protein
MAVVYLKEHNTYPERLISERSSVRIVTDTSEECITSILKVEENLKLVPPKRR